MMIGPEPMTRIERRSVRLGICGGEDSTSRGDTLGRYAGASGHLGRIHRSRRRGARKRDGPRSGEGRRRRATDLLPAGADSDLRTQEGGIRRGTVFRRRQRNLRRRKDRRRSRVEHRAHPDSVSERPAAAGDPQSHLRQGPRRCGHAEAAAHDRDSTGPLLATLCRCADREDRHHRGRACSQNGSGRCDAATARREAMTDPVVMSPVRAQRTYDRIREKIRRYLDKRGGVVEKGGEFLLLVPDFFMLLWRLANDSRVTGKNKVLLVSGLADYILPFDFLPEAIVGPIGYLDDLVFAVYVLNKMLADTDVSIVREHWSGESDVLDSIQRVLNAADSLVGSDLIARFKKMVK